MHCCGAERRGACHRRKTVGDERERRAEDARRGEEESQKIKDKKNAILYSNYDIINSEGKIIKQFIEPDYNKLSTFDFNVILLDHHIGNGY